MSVKIKGMSLPENCLSCPLCMLSEYGDRFCYASANVSIRKYDGTYERNEDCPMEEED